MVPKYVDGKLVYEGVTDAAIKALLGFGSEMGGEIRSLSDYYKLYAITGEDIDTLEEILDVYIPVDPEPTPPEGEWSAYGDSSVSASVSSDKYDVEVAIPTSENLNGSITASDMSWGVYNSSKE